MLLGESSLDSVIDSAGVTIAQQIGRVLRQGGCIVMFVMRPRLRRIYDARGTAEPATHRSEQICLFLLPLIYYFRLDDGFKGGPQGRNGIYRAAPDCTDSLMCTRWA